MALEAQEQSLHRYELLDRIASGGMAEVFRAKAFGAHGFEKHLAIKRILPALAADEEFVARFIEEAKLAVELSHVNIVQVFDFGRFGGSLYIAMEYVDGADLAALLRALEKQQHEIPFGTALYMVIEIAKALDYAHRKTDKEGRPRAIIHRDVSPSNVLLSYEGEVKLADFGIATVGVDSTPARRIMGKWRYMSPEQTEGRPLDARSDQFSAAAVFYELLTGQRLFGGQEISEIVREVRDKEIVPPSKVRPELPAELDRVLLRALDREPAGRYPAMQEMLADLIELSYSRSIRMSPFEAATLVRELVPRPQAAGDAGPVNARLLDDILRSELGLGPGGQARITAVSVHGDTYANTFVRKETGDDGMSVWELAGAARAAAGARPIRSAFGLAALIAAVGLLGAGITVLSSRRANVGRGGAEPAKATGEPGATGPGGLGTAAVAATAAKPDGGLLFVKLVLEADTEAAELWLGGTRIGTAPQSLSLPPGRYVVRATKPGFADDQRAVEVGPQGAQVLLRLTPEQRPAIVDLFSEPWGQIFLDGKDLKRQTPLRGLRVAPGHHELRIVNPYLNVDRRLELDVQPGERKLVRETLVGADANKP